MIILHLKCCRNGDMMVKRLLNLLLTVLLLAGCTARPSAGAYRRIAAQEAAEQMKSETGYMVLDVRRGAVTKSRKRPP